MFGQVLDKLDSWFGRSFLLAWYFPWLLFFICNLLLAAVEFPEVRALLLAEYHRAESSDKLLDIFLALAGVAVIAYTISPAIQPITRLLEGQNLWKSIAEPLLLSHAEKVHALTERSDEMFRDRAGLPDRNSIILRLAQMRDVGASHGKILDVAAITAAEKEIEPLKSLRYVNRPIKNYDLGMAIQVLSAALQRNCADLTALKLPLNGIDYSHALKLDKLHRLMTVELVPYAIDIAQRREAHADHVRQGLFAGAELAPTRLGNDVAALRSYCETRYKFDFDFLWPRLQLAMKDQKTAEKLATAKIQVDFSILCFALSVLFTAIWLVVLGCVGTSFLSLFMLLLIAPAAARLWLWMVHESYSAFAELVRGTIDLRRFDLLEALRRPLPLTTEDEMKTWEQTVRLLMLNEHDAQAFKHPTP